MSDSVQVNLRLDAPLKQALEVEAKRREKTLSELVRIYAQEGLARANGSTLEQALFPMLKEWVEEVFRELGGELKSQILKEMRELDAQSTNRLAALAVKGARSSIMSRLMLYAMIARLSNEEVAQALLGQSQERAGRELQARTTGRGEDRE